MNDKSKMELKKKSIKRQNIMLGLASGVALCILLGTLISGIDGTAIGALIGAVIGGIMGYFHNPETSFQVNIGADKKLLREDLRKAGLILMGAVVLGLTVGPEKMSLLTASPLMAAGYLLWFVGIMKVPEGE